MWQLFINVPVRQRTIPPAQSGARDCKRTNYKEVISYFLTRVVQITAIQTHEYNDRVLQESQDI